MLKTCLFYKLHSHTLSNLRLLPSNMYSISQMPKCLHGTVIFIYLFIYSNCILHPDGSSNYNTKACKHIKEKQHKHKDVT